VDDTYVKLDCVITIEYVGCILSLLHNTEGEMWKALFGVVGLGQAWQACDIYLSFRFQIVVGEKGSRPIWWYL
jgi:hypothetical protein